MNQETKKLLTIGGIIVVVLAVGYWVFGTGPSDSSDTSNTTVDQSLLIKPDSYQSKKSGPFSYKANLVEFADYECPACGAMYPVLKQLLNQYPGELNLIYRNFPIPGHLNEMPAALAAEAAGRQGKFWEMHDLIFESQQKWVDLQDPTSYFASIAQSLGLDMVKFGKDLADPTLKQRITDDAADADKLGVTGTPTMFLNGKKLDLKSYDDLKTQIDAAIGTQAVAK